jgi:predicted O-methyltransferase YrrM
MGLKLNAPLPLQETDTLSTTPIYTKTRNKSALLSENLKGNKGNMSGILKVQQPSLVPIASTATAAAGTGSNPGVAATAPAYTLQMPEKAALDYTLSSVFFGILGQELSKPTLDLISDYIFFNPLDPFVNFSDPEVLCPLLAPECQTDTHVRVARSFVGPIYENGKRPVAKTGHGGYIYPMNPEVLKHAMELGRNKIVLELGGADGAHAVFLGYAGAKRVYMNEIDPTEMTAFRNFKQNVHAEVGERLEPIETDCLQLLEKKPELAHQIDLILCRNLIHFFNAEQLTVFFELLKKLLQPGGKAIFTANSIYTLPDENIYHTDPDATTFYITYCNAVNMTSPTLPIPIYRKITICPEASFSISRTTRFMLYSREPGEKWALRKLGPGQTLKPKTRSAIDTAVKTHKKQLKKIKAGYVDFIEQRVRMFSQQNLRKLFERNGFLVELTFVAGINGHLVHDTALHEKGEQVGIIVQKPQE